MQHSWYNSTLFYQQDKEGGQSRTFDSRALPAKQHSGAAKFAAPPLVSFRPPLAYHKRETRVVGIFVIIF